MAFDTFQHKQTAKKAVWSLALKREDKKVVEEFSLTYSNKKNQGMLSNFNSHQIISPEQ